MRKPMNFVFKTCTLAAAVSVCFAASPVFEMPLYAAEEAAGEYEAQLSTLAGSPEAGLLNGRAETSRFASPLGIDVKNRTVMIADTDNNQVRSYYGKRVVSQAGDIKGRDAWGGALNGYVDSTRSVARFGRPTDCVYLPDNRVAVADRDNNAVRIVDVSWVYTLSGTGDAGYKEGNLKDAMFCMPSGIAADADGNIYVADTGNHCIRKINSDGVTSLVAGVPENAGLKDGSCEEALFMEPASVAVGKDGTIYVADAGNQRIRKISNGEVTTLAGQSTGAYLDTEYRMPVLHDNTEETGFWFPEGICVAGKVVIAADTGNHVIRAISPSGRVAVIAGNGDAGWSDGNALESSLNRPSDVAWEKGTLYIMDTGNNALRSMEFNPLQWLDSIGE